MHNVKLSSTVTIKKFNELVAANNRQCLGEFIKQRFSERYFDPVENSNLKNGFAIMAISCLVIEAIESFYQGLPDTKGQSTTMFCGFFNRADGFNSFSSKDDWFYRDIRCGILHQAETRGGWRILRSGPLLDKSNKSINAAKFIKELQNVVEQYADEIQTDEVLWKNFCKKMEAVCANCK